jgi:hypothetical protein
MPPNNIRYINNGTDSVRSATIRRNGARTSYRIQDQSPELPSRGIPVMIPTPPPPKKDKKKVEKKHSIPLGTYGCKKK